MRSPPHSVALRRGRNSISGQPYLLTTTTWQRAPLFLDHDRARAACRALIDRRIWTRAGLLAWVLMPDHWHGLVVLGDGATLPALMRTLKCNTARACRGDRQSARVWAPGYHDHAVRREESLRLAARYIVANPVRAGLVARVGEWPYWDAVWLREGWSPGWEADRGLRRSHRGG